MKMGIPLEFRSGGMNFIGMGGEIADLEYCIVLGSARLTRILGQTV